MMTDQDLTTNSNPSTRPDTRRIGDNRTASEIDEVRPIQSPHHALMSSAQNPQPDSIRQMFLSSENLRELTGYKSGRKQAEWLSSNGYAFDLRADGRPNVLLAQLRQRQGCCAQTQTGRANPNFSWMRSRPTTARS